MRNQKQKKHKQNLVAAHYKTRTQSYSSIPVDAEAPKCLLLHPDWGEDTGRYGGLLWAREGISIHSTEVSICTHSSEFAGTSPPGP